MALIATLILGGYVAQARASNGDYAVFPMTRSGPTFSKQTGLQIRADSTWAGNRGYRPVKLTASMAKPATADTQITINFFAGGWGSKNYSIRVEADFELSQGAKIATTTISVPQYVDWNSCGWEIWVDGVKDEALSGFNNFSSGATNAVAAAFFAPSPRNRRPTQILSAVVNNSLETHGLDLTNLPDLWIDYSTLDVVVTTASSLDLLRTSSPEKLTTLLRWVRAGGNLWVRGFSRDSQELEKLERLLQPDSRVQAEPQSRPPLHKWHFLKPKEGGRPRLNDWVTLTMQLPKEETLLLTPFLRNSFNPRLADAANLGFVARAYGMGTVVALQENHLHIRISNEQVSSALQRSSLIENLDWATRHGNDPAYGNVNFNNLLIPDVGAAPVFEFQLLISLFVIGIGPVNYWLLKRRNQLPLLLVTVPLAALATTLTLFAYGFLADGIGVRVRVRSMTMLDQREGEAASWARLSYYAGIAPSDGLQMPNDTVVYPIHPSRSSNNSFRQRNVNQQRSLEWSKQQQQLTRGWLASRTPTQYLAITARPTKKQLLFETQPEELTVTNQLGTKVLALVVQDHQGNIFVGDSLDAEDSAKLTLSVYVQAASKIRKLLNDNLPELPAGFITNNSSRRNSYNDNGTAMSDSLMELQFEAIVSPVATGWGNGTYLAVTATGIEVPLGVEGATESSSFHVVRGTW